MEIDQIVKALISVRKACKSVKKSGENKFHGYKYATEADIAAEIRPLMDEHGLVLIPSVASREDGFLQPMIDTEGITQVVLKYTLAHSSGQVWPDPLYVLAHGNDRDTKGKWGDKGAYKANTGGFKYLLLRLLMIETGDDPEQDRNQRKKSVKAEEQDRSADIAAALTRRAGDLIDSAAARQIDKAPQDLLAMEESIRAAVREGLGIEGKVKKNQSAAVISAVNRTTLTEDGRVVMPEPSEKF